MTELFPSFTCARVITAAWMLLFPGTTFCQESAQPQRPMIFQGEFRKRISVNYLLYLPNAYKKETNKLWPLILFLHGTGERGTDLQLVKRHGPPKLIEEGEEFEFVIVSPQCPDLEDWSNDVLINLLDELLRTYRIDKERVYLTGLSMGGWGTWNLAIAFPDRFAAIAPVCGRVDRNNPAKACLLKNVAVWVFHGAVDNVVPVTESDTMVAALRKCGGNVLFTVYPEAGHDSWTATYENPELYRWFLKQKRTSNGTEGPQN